MTHDERRLSDWLDAELDRLAIEGDRPTDAGSGSVYASDAERSLTDTIHRLRRLDAGHAGEPDPTFLRTLEQRLMPSKQVSQPWSGPPRDPSRPESLPAGTRLRDDPSSRAGSSRPSIFTTLVLVIAIVGATLVVTTWDRNGRGVTPGPTTGGFAAMSGDGTPAPDGSTPAAGNGIAWSIPFPDGTREASTGLLLIENGLVYRQITVDTGNEATNFTGVQSFDAVTGEPVWERPMPWSRNGFAADDNGLYTVAEPNRLVALTPESGDPLWDTTLQGAIASLALRDGILYVWDSTNRMTSIDTESGEAVWTSPSGIGAPFALGPNGSPISSPGVMIGDETVAAIAANGTLVAFDRDSGDAAWSAPGFSATGSFTAVTDGMAMVLTTPEMGGNGEPYPDRAGAGIDLSTGEVVWTITVSGEISLPVAPGGTGMFHLAADQVVTNESPAMASTPRVDAEVGGSNGRWPEGTPNNIYGEQGPDGNDFVYGIDARTGQVVWQRSTSGSGFAAVYVSPGSSESLWALTYDNAVIRLAGESGIILDPPVTVIPDPIIRIVIGSLDEGIVAETRGGVYHGFGHVPPEEQG